MPAPNESSRLRLPRLPNCMPAAWSLAPIHCFFAHIEKLAALAAQNKVPAIFGFREFPAAGGLMSYGSDIVDQQRTMGGYVGRILRGEKPGDLPVQQSIKVQLVLNLKAAKTLGITLPQTLQVAADEVIE